MTIMQTAKCQKLSFQRSRYIKIHLPIHLLIQIIKQLHNPIMIVIFLKEHRISHTKMLWSNLSKNIH